MTENTTTRKPDGPIVRGLIQALIFVLMLYLYWWWAHIITAAIAMLSGSSWFIPCPFEVTVLLLGIV